MKTLLFIRERGSYSQKLRQVFVEGGKLSIVLLLFLMQLNVSLLYGQQPCGFDEKFQPIYQSNPQYFNQMETELQEMIAKLKKKATSTNEIVIPIVFHIIHQNEPLEVGGNIPNNQIVAALASLNADFNGSGIKFCLALRDPLGNAMIEPGVQRINGGPSGYNGSLTMGGDEAQIKALSYFTNYRYINIWIVGSILGNTGTNQVLGFANFPKTTSNKEDGIVMDKDFIGIGNWHVLTHEMGHFLNLYHTFEGDCPTGVNCNQNCPNNLSCPPNIICDNDPSNDATEVCCRNQGDRVCDTPPHIRSCGECPITGTNTCDGGTSNSYFVHNHMDYSDESCRNTFSAGQIERMMGCIMTSRIGLTNSLGCIEACSPNFAIDFTQNPQNPVYYGTNVYFTALLPPIGNYQFEWYLDGVQVSAASSYFAAFYKTGQVTVCLRLKSLVTGCTNEICKEVYIVSNISCQSQELNPCEKVFNGDFSQYKPGNIDPIELDGSKCGFCSDFVCNWINPLSSSPFLCTEKKVFGLYSTKTVHEAIRTLDKIQLITGKEYELSFDYMLTEDNGSGAGYGDIEFGFSNELEIYFSLPNERLGTLNIQSSGNSNNTKCDFPNAFTSKKVKFIYTPNEFKSLYFVNLGPQNVNPNIFYIKNISIKTCCPKPKITKTTIDQCTYKFDFTNEGDPSNMFWTIESGQSGNGPSATQSFVLGGTYKVCLYAQCDGVIKQECIFVKTDGCNIIDCSGVIIPKGSKCAGADNGTINFSLDLPEGYKPCGENLYMVPAANYSNYFFNETTNNLQVSANVADPNQGHTIVICGPNGQQICYFIGGMGANGTVCSSCQELTVNVPATCNDTNPNDLNFSYGGNITITPPQGATLCGGTSTSGGYSQGTAVNSGGTFTIPFNINTNSPNPFNSEVTICFNVNDNKICYKVKIVVAEPCSVAGCFNLGTTTLVCTAVKDGTASFNFNGLIHNSLLNGTGWELCSDDGIVLPFGTSNTNLNLQTLSGLIYDVNLSMPCKDLPSNGPITITLNLCKGNETVCFEYLVTLVCAECGGKEGGKRSRSDYKIYPSPATDELYVESPIINNQYLSMYDLNGKLIEKFKVGKGINKLSLHNLNSGLYFCKFSEDATIIHKILITK